MAPPEEAIVSRADWERIQSLLNKPKAKVPTRKEIVEKNLLRQFDMAEDKLLRAQQKKLLAERKLREQAKEEHLNMLAAEERELKRQDWQQTVDKANMKRFHQTGCVRKFNSVVQMTHGQRENKALMELKKKQQRIAEERKKQSEEDMRSRLEEALRLKQEKAHQRRLKNWSIANYHTEQINEKKQLREKQRQQEKEERDRFRYLDELHAQDQRNLAAKKEESKKNYLKYRLEDISSKNHHREREAEKLHMVEEERKRVVSDGELKLQQRKNDQAEKFRKRQIPIEIATDKLAVTVKEQVASAALAEETKLSKEVAEQDAKTAKQLKEKEEKNAAMLKSTAAQREAKIQEKKQMEKAEQKSNQDWLQAHKKSNRLFQEEQKQKAQKNLEDNIKHRDFNATMTAEKCARVEQLKRQDHEATVKEAEQTAKKKEQLQQYVQCELHKAAKDQRDVTRLLAANTGVHGFLLDGEDPNYYCKTTWDPLPRLATDQTRFMKRYLERKSLQLSMLDMTPNRLPPLTKAPKRNSPANGFVGGHVEGSNYGANGMEKLLPRRGTSQTWSTKQNQR
uniref:Trichohyalin-plectin-homology domain-containing protein n=1 Tax=Seriola dumerili TaxID=41447 RepID=A0A3B4TJ30_SERDU